MKKPDFSEKDTEIKNTVSSKGGSYSLVITAIVLAILICVNILASVVPATWTAIDISSAKLYSVTSSTKAAVSALEQDVTIYWIVQHDEEDSVIENLLNKYDGLSSHISVVKRNPDVYPTFAKQYTDEDVQNNSLVVECGERNRYIAYDEIYVSTLDYTSSDYYSYSFDGEGVITSAIDYVTSDDFPQIYLLTGHGEGDLPEKLSDQIKKENYETREFSLINEDAVPEDADCVVIYAPESDISEKEAELLSDYAENGGKLFVLAGPTEDGTLTNLYSVIEPYGVTAADGIVVDIDREHYAFQMPYILLPTIEESDITQPLIDESYYAIIPIAQGLTVSGSKATPLFTTSAESYSKAAGYALTVYDKEDGDTDGPFSLAVSIDTENDGRIIWIASSDMMADEFNDYSSGANVDFGMNALSALIDRGDSVAIRSKSLSYNYLTISDSEASLLKTVMIGICPAAFIIIGIVVTAVRRSKRKRNEQI